MSRARLKRSYGSIAVIFAGTFVLTTSVNNSPGLRFVAIVVGVLVIVMGAYALGVRDTLARFVSATGWLPQRVHLHDDDEGRTHALIETLSGDVLSLSIPSHVADAGTDEAMVYVMETLKAAQDERDDG